MPNCSKCGRSVGCGCNLTQGLCATCVAPSSSSDRSTTFIDTKNKFTAVTKTKNINKEEKLRRINNILQGIPNDN